MHGSCSDLRIWFAIGRSSTLPFNVPALSYRLIIKEPGQCETNEDQNPVSKVDPVRDSRHGVVGKERPNANDYGGRNTVLILSCFARRSAAGRNPVRCDPLRSEVKEIPAEIVYDAIFAGADSEWGLISENRYELSIAEEVRCCEQSSKPRSKQRPTGFMRQWRHLN